jgi:hypothetical protein
MMSSLKKPIKMTIRQHTMRREVLNGYFTHLPTLKDSAMAVASTKPFNKASLVGMIMATFPTAWRKQYNLTHKTIPGSPKNKLLDLENMEKVFVEKYNKKAKDNKAKVATASKDGEARMPRKGPDVS